MAKLNAAEQSFFDSRGETVDPSLTESTPAAPNAATQQPAPPAQPSEDGDAAPNAAPSAQPHQEPAKAPHQVPVSALQAERHRRQQMEQEAQQLRAELEAIRRAQQPQQPAQPQEQPPSFEEDPVGALAFQNQRLQQQLEEVSSWRRQQEEAAQQQQVVQALVQRTADSAREFRAQQPDYDQAFQYLTEQRDKQLAVLIPDKAQREQAMFMEALQLSVQALQAGVSPAQRYYEIAQAWGYTPQQVQPPPAAVQEETPATKAIRRGMKQQSSVTAGGATPSGELTPEQLLAIRDPAAFNKAWTQQFQRR